MNTEGLEHIKIGDLLELSKILKMPFKKARPLHEEWAKRHGLDMESRQPIHALELAKKIVEY